MGKNQLKKRKILMENKFWFCHSLKMEIFSTRIMEVKKRTNEWFILLIHVSNSVVNFYPFFELNKPIKNVSLGKNSYLSH